MSLCIGLTGGIASGKSTVARLFAALNVPIIDADQVARDVVEPGSAGLQAVSAHFGAGILLADGTLDRALMREKVFSDPQQRRALEAILHPLIRQELLRWREQLKAPYGILMAPIMREAGFDQLVDRIVVVDVSRQTQKARLMSRDEISEELAENMLQAQASREQRLAIADDLIDNSGSPAQLEQRVQELHRQFADASLAPSI